MTMSVYKAAETSGPQPTRPLLCPVAAGWPSPSEDYIEGELNLHELLVPHPAATYFLKASGESMIGAGIHNGDLLVVDRSREPVSGKVVIAVIEGELTIKRLVKRKNKTFLVPENPAFAEIDITGMEDASIWGVVTHVVHNL